MGYFSSKDNINHKTNNLEIMKTKQTFLFYLFAIALMLITLASCGNDDGDKESNSIKSQLIGDWYANPDGWKMSFDVDKCTQTLWNGKQHSFNYTLSDNKLTIEGFSGISGTITHIDKSRLVISRKGMSNFEFKKTPNPGWNNDGSGSGNQGNDNNGDDDDPKIPYTNYIHYKYMRSSNYYHEIQYAEQNVQFAPAGTIHGWNCKYLNFYIGEGSSKIGFQFESTYYEDEYPPTTPWPAGKYNITSTSGSAITHYPIARVFVYNDKMKCYAMYPTIGKGEIKYVGNKMIFNFTSNETDPDYYVDIHFEGTVSK